MAFLVWLGAGCAFLPVEDEPLAPPLVEPTQLRVETSEVVRETIVRSTRGTAVLESVATAHHQFTQSGYRLEEILVSSGDAVRKGDTLARLDVPGIEMELLSRQIEAERKRQALDDARSTADEDKIRLAAMELQLAEMALAQTEEKWDDRELAAEIDGVVTFVDRLAPGDWVEPYLTLIIVADPTALQLAFTVTNSNQIADVALGMDVNVAFGDVELTGKVVQTPSSAPFVEDDRLRDKYSKALYIDLDRLPEDVEIGDMANIEIITSVRENALTIPKDALRQYFGRTYVHVLDGEQRKEVDVEAGLENATRVEILSGLEEGQLVIHP